VGCVHALGLLIHYTYCAKQLDQTQACICPGMLDRVLVVLEQHVALFSRDKV